MTRSVWKAPYVDKNLFNLLLSPNHKRLVIKTKSRSTTILFSFIGLTFEVYNGKNYNKVYIEEKMIGRKLGEFVFTRKLGKIHVDKKQLIRKSKK